MKRLLLLGCMCLGMFASSQSIEGTELGIDGFISASNLGGAYAAGPKLGFKINENVICGPSFRIQKSWSNSYGQKYSYTIFGGGAFLHARYKNTLFGGAEFELLKSPLNYSTINAPKKMVPTLFLCGGFSREFSGFVRINAGIYYDIINSPNSPFRNAYMMNVKDQNGNIVKKLPVIYRISFFFPLG
jgi:hypothetical protein